MKLCLSLGVCLEKCIRRVRPCFDFVGTIAYLCEAGMSREMSSMDVSWLEAASSEVINSAVKVLNSTVEVVKLTL